MVEGFCYMGLDSSPGPPSSGRGQAGNEPSHSALATNGMTTRSSSCMHAGESERCTKETNKLSGKVSRPYA